MKTEARDQFLALQSVSNRQEAEEGTVDDVEKCHGEFDPKNWVPLPGVVGSNRAHYKTVADHSKAADDKVKEV